MQSSFRDNASDTKVAMESIQKYDMRNKRSLCDSKLFDCLCNKDRLFGEALGFLRIEILSIILDAFADDGHEDSKGSANLPVFGSALFEVLFVELLIYDRELIKVHFIL